MIGTSRRISSDHEVLAATTINIFSNCGTIDIAMVFNFAQRDFGGCGFLTTESE